MSVIVERLVEEYGKMALAAEIDKVGLELLETRKYEGLFEFTGDLICRILDAHDVLLRQALTRALLAAGKGTQGSLFTGGQICQKEQQD